jgi:hypothetical protein
LGYVFFVADLHLMAGVVHDSFQDCAWLDVVLVADCHQREHFFELFNHLSTRLDPHGHQIISALQIFILSLEDSLHKVREAVVYLQQRVEVTSIADVSQSNGSIRLSQSFFEGRLITHVVANVLTGLDTVLNCDLHLLIDHFHVLWLLCLRIQASVDCALQFSIFGCLV